VRTISAGLSRNIPAEVKRAVRQRCGFGCVVCGASIYEYDHFDPPFAEAQEHNPEGITLLCPTHHAEKTRGVLPISRVVEFNRSPVALVSGEATLQRPYFDHIPDLSLGGGLLVRNTPIPIMVDNEPIIEFMPPEPGSHVARINATLTNADGGQLLRIVDNEWRVESGVWDYEWVGQRMTIRDGSASIALQMTIFPPKYISIDRLTFSKGRANVRITETELKINGSTLVDNIASNNHVGLTLFSSGGFAF
jgi:hypothetical protein